MSKDIIVLAPNGRRQKIHCTMDTSILQILEDTCRKQGFQPSDYNLKHHNRILDLTTTIRFSNLPNKATIEMVETEKKRQETTVTIGLLLEDGERRTADFLPTTALYNIVTSLAPSELQSIQNPAILYMRQEVTGLPALRDKTLRQLGLIKGRAILRLLDKAEEAKQANVSAVYRGTPEITAQDSDKATPNLLNAGPSGPSNKAFDPVAIISQNINNPKIEIKDESETFVSEKTKSSEKTSKSSENTDDKWKKIEEQTDKRRKENIKIEESASNTSLSKEDLERRLNIEKEVTFLGGDAQKALAYMQPDETEREVEDLPDEFYELSIEEVRKMYHDLQQQRISLENTPLLISAEKEKLQMQKSHEKLNMFKHVVVRIQFPDGMILQGVFEPTNTIQDLKNFVKIYLKTPKINFDIFTTPVKETLGPQTTLQDANFVPCVRMHFKWLQDGIHSYLRDDVYTKLTSSEAASLLASKYRAPCRRKLDDSDHSQNSNKPSTSKSSKMPKWFR